MGSNKKSISFGTRGWLLIIVLFFGFMMFQVFTNYPLNILADFYGVSVIIWWQIHAGSLSVTIDIYIRLI